MVDNVNIPTTLEADQVYAIFGQNVRSLREAIGLSQGDLALRVGISRSSVANIEAGRQRIALGDVDTFARAFNAPAKTLLKGIIP